ncbi:Transcriptional regulator [Xanthoria calcicola]
MPQLSGTTKAKSRDGRSRNTTPSSNISIPIATNTSSQTAYLEVDLGKIMVPTNVTYEHLLNQHGGGQGIPDPSSLNQMVDNLKMLGQLATERAAACDAGMRELVNRRKQRFEEERQLELENRHKEEKASLKRAAEEEEARGRKTPKPKKVKKERSSVREERPLAVGAHGLARQDGLDYLPQGTPEPSKASPSPSKRKLDDISSSSLSSASPHASPTTGPLTDLPRSRQKSRASSTSSVESHQPPPAPSVAQYQTFGPDPTTFDDPTIYHIRSVTDEMTYEEKAEIFSVAHFPESDLSPLIAGTIPDKDFSNAKPANQVNANTFQAYIDPYLRPLTEEDMAFLKERGDRVTPFVMPRRGKRHYTEIWQEEDGQFSLDSNRNGEDRLPPNQPRGNLEQMTDEIAETDQISNGPMLNRLLSTMRFENRGSPSDDRSNGTSATNGDVPMTNGLTNGDTNGNPEPDDSSQNTKISSTLPPATQMPESNLPSWRSSNLKMDAATIDDRLKQELRYIGFLAPDSEPDYDYHYDDEVAERLRTLQEELRRVSLENGARKARILELANERMAYQEYATILEDLDGQVQQAYLKRTRTLGKNKKNPKRPGGAGGGSHASANGAGGDGAAAGVSKPAIGDLARQLMNRRQKWVDMIAPVFDEESMGVGLDFRGKKTVFEEGVMERLVKAERERWEEEGE